MHPEEDEGMLTTSLQSQEDIDKQESIIVPSNGEHSNLQDNHKDEEDAYMKFSMPTLVYQFHRDGGSINDPLNEKALEAKITLGMQIRSHVTSYESQHQEPTLVENEKDTSRDHDDLLGNSRQGVVYIRLEE